MENFTPILSLIGGTLIGLATAVLLSFNGKICGISGIVGSLISPTKGDFAWRTCFILGLLCGGVALTFIYPKVLDFSVSAPLPVLVIAGLFVGYGTRLGSGCTSGHGICGLSRLSVRSLVATLCFMTAGFVTVYISHHIF